MGPKKILRIFLIPIKFVIGHRRILSAKSLRGRPKGGLDPLGSSDDGKIEAPPPPTRRRGQRAAEGCEYHKNVMLFYAFGGFGIQKISKTVKNNPFFHTNVNGNSLCCGSSQSSPV